MGAKTRVVRRQDFPHCLYPHPFPNPYGKGTVTSGVCGGLGARKLACMACWVQMQTPTLRAFVGQSHSKLQLGLLHDAAGAWGDGVHDHRVATWNNAFMVGHCTGATSWAMAHDACSSGALDCKQILHAPCPPTQGVVGELLNSCHAQQRGHRLDGPGWH